MQICYVAMDAAFDRLTDVQKENVNRQMFVVAYGCIARAKGNSQALERLIEEETSSCPHLRADLRRYCRLVDGVK